MLEWACYKKIAYELKVSERITLRVVQNRDSHGASPWAARALAEGVR